MLRTWIVVLLLATFATAGVKDAYDKVKRKRGQQKKQLAAEQAAAYAGKVKGADYLYLGFLWQYAEEWDKAVDGFRGYLQDKGTGSKNSARATYEIASSQLNAGKYDAAATTSGDFVKMYSSHNLLNRVRYCQGRARRALDRMEDALDSFRKGASAGNKNCLYEVADCLVQLGKHEAAKKFAAESRTKAARWKTFQAAVDNLGQPLPKNLSVDYWVGTALGLGEIREKVTVWSFWTTKVGNARDVVHDMTNEILRRYRGKIYVIGPAVYLKFNPVDMRTESDMSKIDERDYIEGWKDQYKLRYELAMCEDNTLHTFCGVDPAYPALPAFAITDKKGRLRYVRVGPEAATLEAVDAMVRRLLAE